MGAIYLGNGLFFSISVLTTTYFIVHKLGGGETRPSITSNNVNYQIEISDYSL